MLDLGAVGIGDDYQVVVTDGPVLFTGLGKVDCDHSWRILLDSKEVRFDHWLRRCHLSGHCDLGGGSVAPVLGDGGHIDMVGGEGRQVLDGVLIGLMTDKDGDLGYPDCLSDSLGINKLFVGIIRDLVVDWCQPIKIQII